MTSLFSTDRLAGGVWVLIASLLLLPACETYDDDDLVAEPLPIEDRFTRDLGGDALSGNVVASVDEVVMAGVMALNNLRMVGAEGDVFDGGGYVTGFTPAGERILIRVSRLNDVRSRYTVSIGTFGDDELLSLIDARTRAYIVQQTNVENPVER